MNKEEMEQVILTYNNYLDRMETALQHFCEDILESEYKEMGPVILSVIDGLEWLTEAAENFSKLGKLDTNEYIALTTIIMNIKNSMENKDYVLMHDLVEFELIPLLGDLKIVAEKVN